MIKAFPAILLGLAAIAAAVLFFTQMPDAPSPADHQAMLQRAAGLEPVERAPNFALPDLDGDLHAFNQWRGQVRLVNFWATWCGPCREEVPALIRLHKQYQERGFQVIGIATDESGVDVVKTFAEKYGINYPLLMANGHASSIARHLGFNLIGLPATVLIGRQGYIKSYHLGPINPQVTRQKIEKLLNNDEKPPKTD